jgi:hypothetical protein
MAHDPIPEDIRRFVLTSIASVPHLEALLLLLRAESGARWNVAQVAQRLYISEKLAANLLRDLCESGMTAGAEEGADHWTYRYAPTSPALQVLIDRLAELYSSHLLDITRLIHARLDRKAHQFADAFKWRKEP